MTPKPLSLLNYKQVRERLSCSEGTLRNLAAKGTLRRKYYPGLGYRWTPEEVNRYIREAGIG